MSRADSSSVLPDLRPKREKPPVPRPATLTRRPVRPRVVYCMGDCLASTAGSLSVRRPLVCHARLAAESRPVSGGGCGRGEEALREVGGRHGDAEVIALPFV